MLSINLEQYLVTMEHFRHQNIFKEGGGQTVEIVSFATKSKNRQHIFLINVYLPHEFGRKFVWHSKHLSNILATKVSVDDWWIKVALHREKK
jgi:hypothetical protein